MSDPQENVMLQMQRMMEMMEGGSPSDRLIRLIQEIRDEGKRRGGPRYGVLPDLIAAEEWARSQETGLRAINLAVELAGLQEHSGIRSALDEAGGVLWELRIIGQLARHEDFALDVGSIRDGGFFRQLRTGTGRTQKDVAEAAEIDPAAVSLLERGQREFHLDKASRFAKACGYKLTFVFSTDWSDDEVLEALRLFRQLPEHESVDSMVDAWGRGSWESSDI